MKKLLGLGLVSVGIVVAAASGARNGATYTAYRATLGTAEEAPLPPPGQRLTEWFSAGGAGWGVGLLLIGAGAVVARQAQHAENVGTGGGEGVDFLASLAELDQRIVAMQGRLAGLAMDCDAPEVREELDLIGTEVILPVVEGRGQLMAKHGLSAFAEYFGSFSAGERNLARCWSAITDGHAVVARSALERAQEAFVEAGEAYRRVEA